MSNSNLIESLFKKKGHFEVAVFCTFGLNLNFLENYLMKLDALSECDDICIFTDAAIYQNFIGESYTPRWLNKKYLVNSIKTKGVFHSKLYLLASEKKVLIGIGSPNLTRDGLASNLELLSVFEVTQENAKYSQLLTDCITYVQTLAEHTKSETAIDQIKKFKSICRPLLSPLSNTIKNDLVFLDNLQRPILDQILDKFEYDSVKKVQIISPFYDNELSPNKLIKTHFPSCQIEIYIQQEKSTFPNLRDENQDIDYLVYLYEDIERYLHGKALIVYTQDNVYLFMGSANFTKHALLHKANNTNYEIGIFGKVSTSIVANLLSPNNHQPTKLNRFDLIKRAPSDDFKVQESTLINYLIEAKLNDEKIEFVVDKSISPTVFTPKQVKLLDFDGHTHIEKINNDLYIELTPIIKNKLTEKIAIQIIGENQDHTEVVSNISWLIELIEPKEHSLYRKFRRIYSDPSELPMILSEIINSGDEKALQLFLLQFDISLDLVYPPKSIFHAKSSETKGNMMGALASHSKNLFNSKIIDAYRECLQRLMKKLNEHLHNPQVSRISNYIMIFSSLQSLIWTIAHTIYQTYKDNENIDTVQWSNIRKYFDMLYMFNDHSLKNLLADGNYRDIMNEKLMNNDNSDYTSFDQYFNDQYGSELSESLDYLQLTHKYFEELVSTLKVRIENGQVIEPMIFKNNLHLQPPVMNNINSHIDTFKKIQYSNV